MTREVGDAIIPVNQGGQGFTAISNSAATQLHADQECVWVLLQCDVAESNTIHVGFTGVDETTGITLAAGQTLPLGVENLNLVYAKADDDNAKLRYVYGNVSR